MGLNISKGNMYDFVTHTWNTVKGACYHDCSYCYMKRWGKLNKVRFDNKELRTNLGDGNFIFVGSSCDMWAQDIDASWIHRTLHTCEDYDNKYLFQSKNPERILGYTGHFAVSDMSVVCTTIESNRTYRDIAQKSPSVECRANAMGRISDLGIKTYVTIEPVLDFDVDDLINLIKICNPEQVNIGADSCGHKMPEPDGVKLKDLIDGLSEITTIHNKKNLGRILKRGLA